MNTPCLRHICILNDISLEASFFFFLSFTVPCEEIHIINCPYNLAVGERFFFSERNHS